MAKQTAPVAPPFPFSDDQVVECLEAWAGYPNYQFKRGAMLRADHPAVRQWPEKWCEQGLSDDEKARRRENMYPHPEPQQHVPMALTPKPLLDEDAVICIREIFRHADGDSHLGRGSVLMKAGQRASKRNPLVKAHPDRFVPQVPEGRTRENSVKALSGWTEMRRDASGEFIRETDPDRRRLLGEHRQFVLFHAGQYVDRDSPIVRQYRASFEEIT